MALYLPEEIQMWALGLLDRKVIIQQQQVIPLELPALRRDPQEQQKVTDQPAKAIPHQEHTLLHHQQAVVAVEVAVLVAAAEVADLPVVEVEVNSFLIIITNK